MYNYVLCKLGHISLAAPIPYSTYSHCEYQHLSGATNIDKIISTYKMETCAIISTYKKKFIGAIKTGCY